MGCRTIPIPHSLSLLFPHTAVLASRSSAAARGPAGRWPRSAAPLRPRCAVGRDLDAASSWPAPARSPTASSLRARAPLPGPHVCGSGCLLMCRVTAGRSLCAVQRAQHRPHAPRGPRASRDARVLMRRRGCSGPGLGTALERASTARALLLGRLPLLLIAR